MKRVTVWRLSNGELFDGIEEAAREAEANLGKRKEVEALFEFLEQFVVDYSGLEEGIEYHVSAESILQDIAKAAPTLTKAALEALDE